MVSGLSRLSLHIREAHSKSKMKDLIVHIKLNVPF